MEKMTKKNFYNAMINFAENGEFSFDTEDGKYVVTAVEIAGFAQHEIELLDKKAERSKAAAAKKREESDELMEVVAEQLTNEFQPISVISEAVAAQGVDATVAKVTARLTKLVKADRAVKTDIKLKGEDGKSKTVKGYAVAGTLVDVE